MPDGMVMNPLSRLEQPAVLDSLVSLGTRDPDVLYTARRQWLARVRAPRLLGACLMFAGVGVGWSTGTVVVAGVLGAAGGWLWWRGTRDARTVERAFREYGG